MNPEQEAKTDDFDSAFAQFSYPPDSEGGEEESVVTPVEEADEAVPAEAEEQEAAAEAEPAEEGAEDGKEGVEAEAEGESEEPVEEEAGEPEPEPEPAARDDDDILNRFAELVNKQAQQQEQPPQQEQQEQQEQQPEPAYTPEEQEFLQNYEKDWPDVARAESLRRRSEYQQLVGYVFNQIAQELRPLMETVQTVAERTHYNDLTSAVQDYDTIRDDVVAWVEEQPAYLQQAYKHVIEQGTVDEVSDLVDRFKRETGRVQAQAAPARKEAELPKTAKKAAESLAPVSSKRSAPPEPDDPNDFDRAFSRFADQLKM